MDERAHAPDSGGGGSGGGGSGESPSQGPEVLDEAHEAALMREIMRQQERHREGGVEPELEEGDEEPRPEA